MTAINTISIVDNLLIAETTRPSVLDNLTTIRIGVRDYSTTEKMRSSVDNLLTAENTSSSVNDFTKITM
jgi:hypothetical protein